MNRGNQTWQINIKGLLMSMEDPGLTYISESGDKLHIKATQGSEPVSSCSRTNDKSARSCAKSLGLKLTARRPLTMPSLTHWLCPPPISACCPITAWLWLSYSCSHKKLMSSFFLFLICLSNWNNNVLNHKITIKNALIWHITYFPPVTPPLVHVRRNLLYNLTT